MSSSASNAKIEIHLDSQTGTLLGTCDVSGASSWTTKTCQVSGGSGKHDLFMKFVGGNGDLFKFNWWKFTQLTTGMSGRKPSENPTGPDRFEVSFVNGETRALRLDFSQPVLQKKVTVDLMDLTGRRISTLFTAHVTSSSFSFPLPEKLSRSGVLLIRVSLDGRTVLTEKTLFK